jgi:hypothetical protein
MQDKKDRLPVSEIWTQFLCRPSRSPVAIPTELLNETIVDFVRVEVLKAIIKMILLRRDAVWSGRSFFDVSKEHAASIFMVKLYAESG